MKLLFIALVFLLHIHASHGGWKKEINELKKSVAKVDDRLDDIQATIATFQATIAPIQATIAPIQATIATLSETILGIDEDINALEAKDADIESKTMEHSLYLDSHYCILANGSCPPGFTRFEGYLRALRIHNCTDFYIKEVYFGDSSLKKHNCQTINDTEINLVGCCK